MNPGALTQAEFDAISYAAAKTAKDEVDARIAAFEQKALVAGAVALAAWFLIFRRGR